MVAPRNARGWWGPLKLLLAAVAVICGFVVVLGPAHWNLAAITGLGIIFAGLAAAITW